MLPTKNRVGKKNFDEVMKGRSIHSTFGSLRFIKTNSGRKFSAVVPKKSYSKAVDRNKLKRRARAITRPALFKLLPGSYILFLKKGALEISFKELEKEILELFRKVK